MNAMSMATEQPPRDGEPPAQPASRLRVAPLIFAGLSILIALVLLAAGGAGIYALTQRDNDGYFTAKTHALATRTHGFATSSLDISDAPGWVVNGLGTVRIRAASTKPIFLGIGSASDVNRYLARVQHTEVTDFDTDPFRVTSHTVAGASRPAAPASQHFWVAQASGPGTRTVSWDVKSGKWSAVAMNADGTRNVALAFKAGASVPALKWVTIGVLAGGIVFLLLGGWLVYLGVRGPRPQSATR